jgi:D-alanyl-D-alanine carboxypeptidase
MSFVLTLAAVLLGSNVPARPALAPVLKEQVTAHANRHWQVGIAIASCRGDSLLFGWNEATPLKPASNQKLLITTLALDRWDDSLARELDCRLAATPTRKHLIPVNRIRAESLGLSSHPEIPGYCHLVLANRESDNDEAEWMLDILCRRLKQTPYQLITEHLDRWNVPRRGLRVWDACGLGRRNRASPLTLATLLAREHARPNAGVFTSTLACPRAAGTLIHRDLDVGDRLRAKTGYIRDVFALSGYLAGTSDTFAFSFILNGCGSGTLAYQFFNVLLNAVEGWDAGAGAGCVSAPASVSGQN